MGERPHIEQKVLDDIKKLTGLNQNTVIDLLLKGWSLVSVAGKAFAWQKKEI